MSVFVVVGVTATFSPQNNAELKAAVGTCTQQSSVWDCFGSDSDEDEELDKLAAEAPSKIPDGLETIASFVKSAVMSRVTAAGHDFTSRVWIGIDSDADKLLSAIPRIQNTLLCQFGKEPGEAIYDIVVSASTNMQGIGKSRQHIEECRKRLVPGGTAVFSIPIGLQLSDLFLPSRWNLATLSSTSAKGQVIASISSLSTLGNFSPVQLNLNTGWIVEVESVTEGNALEQSLLEAVTVSLTSEERHAGTMNDHSIDKSVMSMRKHGLCIIRGLFRKASAQAWAQAALADVRAAHDILKTGHGIDLVGGGESPRNFYEMSMVRMRVIITVRSAKHVHAL